MAANNCVTHRPPPRYPFTPRGTARPASHHDYGRPCHVFVPFLGTHLTVHAPSIRLAAFAAC
eukprot:8003532-Alexandrium_andersonii.AAC.1